MGAHCNSTHFGACGCISSLTSKPRGSDVHPSPAVRSLIATTDFLRQENPFPPVPISESAAPGNTNRAANGRCTTPSRPSAPEGVAQGRAPMLVGKSPCRSRFASVRSTPAAEPRAPVSSEPYLRRHRGMMVSRKGVAIRFRASRAHGHFALAPPWTTPGRGTAPAWSGSNRSLPPSGARPRRPPSRAPSAAGCVYRGG